MCDDRPNESSAHLYADAHLDELRRKEKIAQLRKSLRTKHRDYIERVNKQLKLFQTNPNPE